MSNPTSTSPRQRFRMRALKHLSAAQVWVYRRTGGRVGSMWHPGAGLDRSKRHPVMLLDHRGRTSGRQFTTPILYTTDGADVVVAASLAGHDRHPQWYRNLVAHPRTTIQVGGELRTVDMHTADATERRRLWAMLVESFSDFAVYQSRTDREIPVVVLAPATHP